MEKLTAFVSQHMSDDTARLILSRDKWPGIDMDLAVNCIESRRKLKGKVQEWYEDDRLVFPARLSAEQCSSTQTAEYKASFAAGIGKRIADLTGGLGVDSWFFSKKMEEVLYNEMQECLYEAAAHNFRTLDLGNIRISCRTAQSGGIAEILNGFRPDIIYMDPARRGEGGKKVFLIEECTPDVLTLRDELFGHAAHILIKLSPMADITMVCERLGSTCREVHVVASGGECKELLIWMDRDWNDEYTVTAVELPPSYPATPARTFSFKPSEEKECIYTPADISRHIGNHSEGLYIFEPGKAMMKAGAFNLMSTRLNAGKLGHSTHYYITDVAGEELIHSGKVFRVIRIDKLDKRSVKAVGKEFPKADVTARNIPMTSEELCRKLGCASGNGIHIFGLKSDKEGALLITAERIAN